MNLNERLEDRKPDQWVLTGLKWILSCLEEKAATSPPCLNIVEGKTWSLTHLRGRVGGYFSLAIDWRSRGHCSGQWSISTYQFGILACYPYLCVPALLWCQGDVPMSFPGLPGSAPHHLEGLLYKCRLVVVCVILQASFYSGNSPVGLFLLGLSLSTVVVSREGWEAFSWLPFIIYFKRLMLSHLPSCY